MKKFYTIILCTVLCFLASVSKSQTLGQVFEHVKNIEKVHSKDAQSLLNISNLIVDYKYLECNDRANGVHNEYLILELSNPLQNLITVDFDLIPWYDGVCVNCNDNQSEGLHRTFQIQPGQKASADCTNLKNALFSKMLNAEGVRELTNFSITNLIIQ
jgi:hypothetical protein